MSKNHIAILDFGSQYTHLIARRLRELNVRSFIYPNNIEAEKLINVWGVILSGGPQSVQGDRAIYYDKKIFDLGLPILGICHGHQLIAKYFGGQVASGGKREYGLAKIRLVGNVDLFSDIQGETQVWMSHGDNVEVIPDGFISIAISGIDSASAIANKKRKIYGVQFHPEVNHTNDGKKILANFVFKICNAKKNWDTDIIIEQIEQNIKEQAQGKKVFMLVSGGVDSTVCYCLLQKYLGKENVFGLHIDHGYMRQNESKIVISELEKNGITNIEIKNAKDVFFRAVGAEIDPEKKRKIIGETFIKIADEYIKKNIINDDWLLGQGTIYPDTIESGGTKNAEKIKTHHNRVDVIRQMIEQGKVIEPIKDLYKDEVRSLGRKIGLPSILLDRHPFPGPGLAIRCLGAVEDKKNQVVKDNINGIIYDFYRLPIQSVGVQGDNRTYHNPGLLVSKGSFSNWHLLRKLSPKLTNSRNDINRVLYFLSGDENKLKQSIVSKAYLSEDRIKKLCLLDNLVNKYVFDQIDCQHIWQMPIVLLPFGHSRKESLVLRPVESEEAMTVSWAEIPEQKLNVIVSEIKKTDLVDYVFLDITNKPPGTIEWE